MPGYSPAIEEQMRAFYHSLSEKDRRRYAAIEAAKLGDGGISYVARVLAWDRHTITQGLQELTAPEALHQSRLRRVGGGRKPSHEVIPGLEAAFLQVLQTIPPAHVSSVVDWPTEAGRDRGASRKIPLEVCAAQRAQLRGCPETFAHRCPEIMQPPCGNATQGDRRERVGSASDVYD